MAFTKKNEETNQPDPEITEQVQNATEEQAAPAAEQPSEIEKLTAEKDALAERNLRLMAEFDNYRKRTQKEREQIYPDATAAAITKLLPVLDNFHRALETACSDEGYAKGIKLTYDSFRSILDGMGVQEIGVVGESFDPNFHNAVMHIEDESLEKNTIVQVFQLGYKIGERVLRPAMVQVAN